jgi:hypothetical protein
LILQPYFYETYPRQYPRTEFREKNQCAWRYRTMPLTAPHEKRAGRTHLVCERLSQSGQVRATLMPVTYSAVPS